MASGKKSFILYADQAHTFNELSDKEAGVLIKHIMKYVNDENPVLESKLLKIAFEPIRLQLKRDLKQWEDQREKRSEAGKKGMEKRWSDNKAITKDNSVIKPITKITDNVNVNVNVNDNVTVNKEEPFLWTDQVKQFHNDFRWKEKTCIDEKVSMKFLEEKMREFISLTERRDDFKELKELKRHFTNWFLKNKIPAGSSLRMTKTEVSSAPPLKNANELRHAG